MCERLGMTPQSGSGGTPREIAGATQENTSATDKASRSDTMHNEETERMLL
jgi:hypothetical protein